jgi:DtxR family transcriptional regulator, Mn-dependent transcriptional regulator
VLYFTKDKVHLIFCEANLSYPSVSIEDYLGAIFRLQPKDGQPLPLGELQEHFGFSPISIHEMIQKLVQRGLAEYLPYKGVLLTGSGTMTAAALVRRHRIWECFLADELQVPIDEAHQLAGDLEHAAPDWITERLFSYIKQPESCPHGNAINELAANPTGIPVIQGEVGREFLLSRIYPENSNSLQIARGTGMLPGETIRIIEKNESEMTIQLRDQIKKINTEDLMCFWGMDISDGA